MEEKNKQEKKFNDEAREVHQTQKEYSSKREKFFLLTGIIGLIADIIALTSFLAIFFKGGETKTSSFSWSILFVVMTGLILFYSWAVLSWNITRRALSQIPNIFQRIQNLENSAMESTRTVGLLLIPFVLVWLLVGASVSGVAFVAMLFIALVGGLLGWLLIAWSLTILMQAFYEDLVSDVQMASFISSIEQNWSEWKKRIDFELQRYKWISVKTLQDKSDLIGVPMQWLEFVFAKYTSKYPEKAKYGYLWKREGDKGVLIETPSKVLAGSYYELGEYYVA